MDIKCIVCETAINRIIRKETPVAITKCGEEKKLHGKKIAAIVIGKEIRLFTKISHFSSKKECLMWI